MRFINVNIVIVLAAIMISCCTKEEKNEVVQNNSSKSTIDVIHERTSIRSYTNQEVSREQLEILVRAGMAAPSAMNKQPWQFVVIDDKELLSAIGEISTSKMAKQAPAAILVCGDLEKAGEGWLQEYWIQDCSAAAENILLAITDLGLGGVWTSIYPAENRMEIITNLFQLPETIIPFCVIPLGYPTQNHEPKNKWNPENVHWNKW
jgi:nitroreductase